MLSRTFLFKIEEDKENNSSLVNASSCYPVHMPPSESVSANCKFMSYITGCGVNFNK